jgi:hypothetical protein
MLSAEARFNYRTNPINCGATMALEAVALSIGHALVKPASYAKIESGNATAMIEG